MKAHAFPDGHLARCRVDITDRNGHGLETRWMSGMSRAGCDDQRSAILADAKASYGEHHVYVFFNWLGTEE